MVAYTKDEEDFIFDVWRSVRRQDKDNGVLESSSNRQRYIKVYEAYKNQGYTRTYSQIETKLKKHRASFIKVYSEGIFTGSNPSCPRYNDLLEMFGDVYRSHMEIQLDEIKDEKRFNDNSQVSYLQLEGVKSFSTPIIENQVQTIGEVLTKSKPCPLSRKLNYSKTPNSTTSASNPLHDFTNTPISTSTQAQHASQMRLLRGIREDNRAHAAALTSSIQTLAAAIMKLVDSSNNTNKISGDQFTDSLVSQVTQHQQNGDAHTDIETDQSDRCESPHLADKRPPSPPPPPSTNHNSHGDDESSFNTSNVQCDDDEADDDENHV